MSSIDQDRLLLTEIAEGNGAAIETLYRRYFSMVQNMVLANAGTGDDAADLFQETILVLYNKVSGGEFELQSLLKTFLYAVARRLWLKKLNERFRDFTDPADVEELIAVEDDLELHQQKQRDFDSMDAALEAIGEPCKSLLKAFYLEKKHMQDIANRFGYTNADNAKTQKYKCLMRLKKLFFARHKHKD